jgi:large subunit ribosomal protein L24e
MLVKKDGTIFYFCSTKCQNYHKVGRVPRRVEWTGQGRKAASKKE